MPLLMMAVYLVVEIGALVWLASTIGMVWTLAVVLATSVAGVVLVRSQGRRVIDDLRAASRREREPATVAADGALVTAGSLLLLVPGLVSSLLGILLLVPWTRAAVRPVMRAALSRLMRRLGARSIFGGNTVIVDGEVVRTTASRSNAAPLIVDSGGVGGPDLRTSPRP